MDCHSTQSTERPLSIASLALLIAALQLLPAPAAETKTSQATPAPTTTQSPITANSTDPALAVIRAMRHDAALADICFIDANNGWAVGDRGVICHTADAGATWHEQQSGATTNLSAVSFVDAQRGWAVGGASRPKLQAATRGIVLRTEDGGQTWTELPRLNLPRLTGVKFFDPTNGIAFGECAPLAPAGVFTTRDGGNTWLPAATDYSAAWLAGDFLAADFGALAGPAGQLATFTRGKVTHSPLAASSLRSFRAMRLAAPTGGWAVGDGGLVMTTHDAGRSWQTPPADLPAFATESFDFHALAVQGSHVWVAGTPGTRILHSPDNGQSWEVLLTNQTLPIRALTFIDTEHGYAAGDLGTILATTDGGRTWRPQRAGGRRAAILTFFADPADIPLELLADSGAAEGYLITTTTLCTPTARASSGEPTSAGGLLAHTLSTRHQEAHLLAGANAANTAWRFPLPAADLALSPADLLQALNRENDGRALHQLEAYLVRELRTWRPDIVVTYHAKDESASGSSKSLQQQGAWGRAPVSPQSRSIPSSSAPTAQGAWGRASASPQKASIPPTSAFPAPTAQDNAPFAALIEQLVLQAIELSADPAQHPELTNDAGLSAWQVKKVYGVLPPGERGDELLATGRFSPFLGTSLGNFAAPARALLATTSNVATAPPDTYELKLLASNVPDTNTGRGIFAGIPLTPGSDARRPTADLPEQDLEALRRLTTRRRHLQELMQRSEGNAAWAGQVASMIDGLASNDGGQLLAQLAEGYRKTGRLDLAADTYYLLARRYPDHPLADQALAWLVQFYGSSEISHRLATTTGRATPANRTSSLNPASGEPASAGGESAATSKTSTIQQTSALLAAPATLTTADRLRRAAQLADYLRTTRPALYDEPAIRFTETTAQRELGFANPAQRFFLTLRQLPETDAWRECAATEEWLAQPGDNPPPKKLARCVATLEPPHLDGHLDEQLWATADRLRLNDSATPVGQTFLSVHQNDPQKDNTTEKATRRTTAFAQLAHDQKFLYLAIECPKVNTCDYTTDASPRPHDADLTQHDRVTIRLDTDRDYNTAFELTVDNRGYTADACWTDATWNPTWYIAAASDDKIWTIEAAIPLAELTAKPLAPRNVWAVSAERTIPRVGYQSWTGPPTPENSPANFGLLIFQ
ncbi:MAG: YCF48-related protein [Pirellulales bacterium]